MTHEQVPTKEQWSDVTDDWLLYWLGYFDADGRSAQFEMEQCPDDDPDCTSHFRDEMNYNWRKFNEVRAEMDRRGIDMPRTLHGDESEWNG